MFKSHLLQLSDRLEAAKWTGTTSVVCSHVLGTGVVLGHLFDQRSWGQAQQLAMVARSLEPPGNNPAPPRRFRPVVILGRHFCLTGV